MKEASAPILICGFMGTGKSTVGKILAANLKRPFLDLDDVIESKAGMSITSIFEKQGEIAFRKLERVCLFETLGEFNGVLALGGGALQDQHVVDRVKLSGLLIFIETSISVILERISVNTRRPLLLNKENRLKDRDELYSELTHLYLQRLPYYKQADVQIKSSEYFSAKDIAEELTRRIQHHDPDH